MVSEEKDNKAPEEGIPAELTLEEKISTLEKALAEANAKAEANLAGWQRAQADFVNYRRRFEQEKEETAKYANAALVTELLPVLDDLEMALDAVPQELAGSSWVEGIRLIVRKLQAVLEAKGLVSIESRGKPFDPRYHEAISQSEGEEGIVTSELQKGYTFCDRLIRPCKVVVGTGNKEKEENHKQV